MIDEREIVQIENFNYITIFEPNENGVVLESDSPVAFLKIEDQNEVRIIEVTMGIKGDPGDSVEIRVNDTHIQTKNTQDTVWTDLIPLSSLVGPEGPPGTGTGSEPIDTINRNGSGYISTVVRGTKTYTIIRNINNIITGVEVN